MLGQAVVTSKKTKWNGYRGTKDKKKKNAWNDGLSHMNNRYIFEHLYKLPLNICTSSLSYISSVYILMYKLPLIVNVAEEFKS